MRLLILFGGILISLLVSSSSVSSNAEHGFALITPQEYARELDSTIRYKALAIPEPGAPKIELVEPREKDAITVPIKIHIAFKSEDDAHIVVDTVRILYGWLGIDITERIRRHAEITSLGITAENAELPLGSHRITIRVADSKDRRAESTFRFRVVE